MGQADEKEVYFYLGYIIDCELLPTHTHTHSHKKVFITYAKVVGRFERFYRRLVSVNADFRTTLAAAGRGVVF